MNDRELLEMQAATNYVLTNSGRIVRRNTPDHAQAARFSLAGSNDGNIVRLRHDVSEETAESIKRLVADEPPFCDPYRPPTYFDDYIALLATDAPVERHEFLLAWTFPDNFSYQHSETFVKSGTPDGSRLIDRFLKEGMPDYLVELGFVDTGEFWEPWCVTLHEGQIASIAFTVSQRPESAEVGIITVPTFRGRGFAAAATAGWATHPAHRRRTLFYSTSTTNISSQRVTQRLGLRFIGARLSIT